MKRPLYYEEVSYHVCSMWSLGKGRELYIGGFVLLKFIEQVKFACCAVYICKKEYHIGRIFRYT